MRQRVVVIAGVLLVLSACSGNDTSPDDGAGGSRVAGPQPQAGSGGAPGACTANAQLSCACPDQTTGTARCNAAGTAFGVCDCGEDGAGGAGGSGTSNCVPGASTACTCTSGDQGAQVCNAAGRFDPCVCTGSTSGAGGMTAGAGGTAGEAGQGGSGECDSLGWVDDASQLCWHAGGITDGMTHRDAQLFCQALAGGLSGWRLPTVDELKAQVRGCSAIESCEVSDPDCLDSSCAPNDSSHPCYGCEELAGPGPAGCYWQNAFGTACLERVVSGTEVSDGSGLEFWTVSFSTGGVADDFAAGAVLCVKPAQ